MTLSRHCLILCVAVGFVANAGCSFLRHDTVPEPKTNLAAHTASRGVVVDQMGGGQHGVLIASHTFSGPQFLLQTAGSTIAAFWTNGSTTVVRRGADGAAPSIGQVDAIWEEKAIRFTLKPAAGGSFSTSLFKRVSGGASPEALGQRAVSLLDLRGAYRTNLVDADGNGAGWIGVEVDARWGPTHVYNGMLPEEIEGPLAVAVIAQLEAALGAVEEAADNPYIGN
jgi:hypothetical protein